MFRCRWSGTCPSRGCVELMRRRCRRGMAMLLVLSITIVLSIMALAFHDEMAQRLIAARMTALDLEAQALARGGIGLVKAIFLKDQRGYTFFPTKADAKKAKDATLDGKP